MPSNIDRYRQDLDVLLGKGANLLISMQKECFPDKIEPQIKKYYGNKAKQFINKLPEFKEAYQSWYSEAKALIKQLLPDRIDDFVKHYEKPKPRKNITYENYAIEDYLQGLSVTRGWQQEKLVGPDAAIPRFQQQLAILKSVKARFESTLFDIRQIVRADLFDSELDAAKELVKNKYTRAAGALAGVVLEKHLAQACENHKIYEIKRNPSISDLINALKDAGVIDTIQWRYIQHLADIRNLCDHNKIREPTQDEVDGLVLGVAKTIKTLY